MEATLMRVAVVGGGIAGLAAAWELRGRAEVTVFEPERLGGRILTSDFRGRPVDEGPDAFLTRVPEAVQLCEEIGLAGQLVAPAAGRSAVWIGGRLRELPGGLVLGVPSDLRAVLASGVLSPAGMARAALDLLLPRRGPVDGSTVRQLVAGRFGAEVADRLVDPLVGGIHAGWTGTLGVEEVTPQIAAVARRSRSLLLGLRSASGSGRSSGVTSGGPVFLAPRPGMGALVDGLVAGLREHGTILETRRVGRVTTRSGGMVGVDEDGRPFDAAVLAVPAAVAARLLDDVALDGLESIPTASVAIVTAAVASTLPEGLNGFLVPRVEGRLMTACSFGSNKWPHWAGPGESVVRLSAGRFGRPEAMDLADQDLAGRLLDELGQALGTGMDATEWRVSRWPDSFPQYLPGHGQLVAELESTLSRGHPGVFLAGASYRGSGIPACVASGRLAARRTLARAEARIA